MQRISSLSTVLAVVLLLPAGGEELLGGLAAVAFRVGAMAAPAGACLLLHCHTEAVVKQPFGTFANQRAGRSTSHPGPQPSSGSYVGCEVNTCEQYHFGELLAVSLLSFGYSIREAGGRGGQMSESLFPA